MGAWIRRFRWWIRRAPDTNTDARCRHREGVVDTVRGI
ncbi:hypothetical protein HMPREF1317_1346 [Schaalia georgiae F0490]|uniref:Uncharacterized protein n=1 Tax=Schaalia georgiae F0490 TaxID=1125717 RepID=J1HTQ9_9ACTO|nr:hypothetical protein HMPREF1317_1346 [Schaalia georgiae F0490]